MAANSVCASGCALIWLAGSPRCMSSSAQIGFHAAYLMNAPSGLPEVSSSANAVIGAYLNALGLPEVAISRLINGGGTN